MEIKESILKNLINIKTFSCNKEQRIKHVIIAIHGFTGSKDSSTISCFGENLVSDEVEIVAFDLPNHGKNKSNLPIKLNDCFKYIEIVDEYVKKKYKNVQISYFATSFGGYLLLNFLNNATHKYNKIILRAPAINIDKVLKEKIIKDDFCKLRANEILNIQDIKIDYEFYRDLENNRLIDNYKGNRYLYVIQGKKDEIVDYKDNEFFFENKCKDKYQIYYFDNSKHSFKTIEEKEDLLKIVKGILDI